MDFYPGSAPVYLKPSHYFYIVNIIALLEIFVCNIALLLFGFHLQLRYVYLIFFDVMHYLLFAQGIAVLFLSNWIDDIWGKIYFSCCVAIYGILAILDISMLKLNPWLQNAEYRERQRCIRQGTDITTYDGTGIHECNICLNNFEIGDEIQNTPCQHRYHRACLTTWLNMASTCPNCRVELLNPEENSEPLENDEEDSQIEIRASDHE